MAIFVILHDGGRRHHEFSKIRIFNGRSAVRGQCASPCQISAKSVKRLQRYGDLMDFFNGGRPPCCICWALVATTDDDQLAVSILIVDQPTLQNVLF